MDVAMNVEVDVRRIALQPGDKVWIETPYRLNPEQALQIYRAVVDWAEVPIEAVLILQDKMTLRVLSKEDQDNACTGNP